MKNKKEDADKIVIKQKKGTWLRFVKLFPKCRLPWVWLAVYIILELGFINIGLSETEYTAQLFSGDTSAALLFKLIAVMIINLVASNILIFTSHITSARINKNMRSVVFGKVMRLPMSYFKDENPRDAIYRISNNAIVIDSTIMLVIIPLAMAAYKSFMTFFKIFNYDWRLSIILVAFIPIQIFTGFIFGRINFSLSERDASVRSGLTQKLAELVTNIPLAKAFAKEKHETEKGEELTSRLYKINIKSSWLSQLRDLSETATSLIQSIIMVLVGYFLLRNGDISQRTWISFFMFSSLFTGAITEFIMYWNNLKTIQGGADRVAEIMNAEEENRKGNPCTDLRGDIKIDRLRFGYDEEKTVLNDITCEFKDNKVTALLGVSGCGKTTLINLITRLYEPLEGAVTIGGEKISDYALDDYRSQFVMVSQNSMLFSGSIKENICYGNGEVSEEAFKEALKKSGAYDFVMNLPDKELTRLEEYGNNLSGGQRQRISVARALLSDAHYLILDEPAASMDAIAASELMDILKNISKDRCMIVIAHTASVLPLAERVVILENGEVSAQGETEELKKTNRFLREFSGEKVS